MDIYLIRHTEVAVERGVFYGHSDVGLATNYAEQRDRLKRLLPSQPAHIFASPLSRCRQLAEDLALDASLTVQFDDRLKELNYGDWEMLTSQSIPPDRFGPWLADYANIRPPNGENFQDLGQRVNAFWQEQIIPLLSSPGRERADRAASDPLFIVAHGGVIRVWLSLFLEFPLSNAYRIHLDYGSVTKITTTGVRHTIQYVNQ